MDAKAQKSILVLLLFPLFGTPAELQEFVRALKIALVVDGAHILVFNEDPRKTRPAVVHMWLTNQLIGWTGSKALICWAGAESIEQASSKIGTLDMKVHGLREAQKILMVDGLDLPLENRKAQYPS